MCSISSSIIAAQPSQPQGFDALAAIGHWLLELVTEQTLKGLLTHSKLAVDLGPAAIRPSLYDCPSTRLLMHDITRETPWHRLTMLEW